MNKTIIALLNKLKVLKFFNTYSLIRINKRKIVIPLLGGLGIENLNLSEPWMTKILIKLKPLFSGEFIDIGVNTGQTLIKAYTILDNIRYTGFEPNATCVNYLQQLIVANKFENCNIIPVGISNASGILKLNFYYSSTTDSSASIIAEFRPQQQIHHSIYVPVFNYSIINYHLPDCLNPILKIDVEGAELEVLQGIYPWVEKVKPIILIEILPVYNSENLFRLSRQQTIESMLCSLDYKISRINKTSLSLTDLSEIGIHSSLEDCDYILYSSSLKEKIDSLFK